MERASFSTKEEEEKTHPFRFPLFHPFTTLFFSFTPSQCQVGGSPSA